MIEYDVYVDDVQLGDPQAFKTSIGQIEATINQRAQAGWELVAVEHLVSMNPKVVAMVHYLKRQAS